MKLTDKWQMSRWAYRQCLNGNDTPEMRNLITNEYVACLYCIDVKDIKEMWYKIKDPSWAEVYCKHVKNRQEVRKLYKK